MFYGHAHRGACIAAKPSVIRCQLFGMYKPELSLRSIKKGARVEAGGLRTPLSGGLHTGWQSQLPWWPAVRLLLLSALGHWLCDLSWAWDHAKALTACSKPRWGLETRLDLLLSSRFASGKTDPQVSNKRELSLKRGFAGDWSHAELSVPGHSAQLCIR